MYSVSCYKEPLNFGNTLYICQLNVSRGQDSVSGIVGTYNSQRFVYLRDRVFVLFATANGYPAFKEF
jgi:hypothetical protein